MVILSLVISSICTYGSGAEVPIRRILDDNDEDDDVGHGTNSASHKPAKRAEIINFAAESAGAIVLAGSDECKGFSNILNNDKDRYAMCPCSAKRKYVTISLSEDVSCVMGFSIDYSACFTLLLINDGFGSFTMTYHCCTCSTYGFISLSFSLSLAAAVCLCVAVDGFLYFEEFRKVFRNH